MKKMINSETIQGRVYQHDLVVKTVQDKNSDNFGTEYISGNLEIATDEEGLNIIPVHFTYVTEETSKGKKNLTFKILKQIIEEDKAWVTVGKDAAQLVKVDTALALNEFYNSSNELVSAKRNEGGFVSLIKELPAEEKERNKFEVDMLVTNFTFVEKDEEKNINEDYGVLKGAIFNFRNELMPIDFIIKLPAGLKYFEELNLSNAEPLFTKLRGRIICETKTTVVTEESAFGEAAVKTFTKKTKTWLVESASNTPYDFGDEAVLTVEEVKKMSQDREIHLAELRQRTEKYKMNQVAAKPTSAGPNVSAAMPNSAATAIKQGTFNF